MSDRIHCRLALNGPGFGAMPSRLKTRLVAIPLLFAACGGSDKTPNAPDAQQSEQKYVVDSVKLPVNASEVTQSAVDLDGDTRPDNQIGAFFAFLKTQGFDFNAATTANVDRGGSITLVEVDAADLQSSPDVVLRLYSGTNAMPAPCMGQTCRQHLQGTGSFSVSPTPRDILRGEITDGKLKTTGEPLHISISFGATPITIAMVAGRIDATQVTQTAIPSMIIGGAITNAEMDRSFYPGIVAAFSVPVEADCDANGTPPDCGCTANSTGASLLSLLDRDRPQVPRDCKISVDEFKNSSLATLLRPDITVNGLQAISFGVAATAVKASFTP